MIFNEWKKYSLENICEQVRNGYTPNGSDNLAYIGLEHIEQQTLRLLGIGKSSDITSNKFKFESGDILFGKLRPYFRKVYRPKFSGICSTDISVFRARKNFETGFLFYLVASKDFIDYANAVSSGTRMPRADWNLLKNSEWSIPNLLTQQRIASILSSLDDAIELNQQINKTLEDMAKAIFKEWFVDFNFPNAIGKFQETEIGKIPVGWKVGKLSDGFDITMGQSPPGDSYNEENIGTPFFQGRTDFEFRFPSNRIYTTQPKRFAKKLDTLVSVRAPVGDMNIASEDCCIGRGLAAVIHKNGNASFTYYFLNSLVEKFKMFEGTGTVFGSINKTDFENMVCIYSTIELIDEFERICSSFDEQIYNNEKENQSLINLRDTLLPKLMKGEIALSEK
ncbi:MAG: restriction endonuclease subunit S [Deltaproteobacteria bacterium]